MSRPLPLVLPLTLAFALLGCNEMGLQTDVDLGEAADVGADYGVTPGGAQDLGYARSLIEDGQVPPADSVSVEGLLNEHDVPLEGDSCEDLICAEGASGVGRVDAEGADSVFLQIGFDTALTEFERGPQNLVVVMDVSGSMSGELDAIKAALKDLVSRLDEGDRLALVTYGSEARVVLPSRTVDDPAAINAAIASLSSGGSTNMEAGLSLAFAEAAANAGGGRDSRVMLFTDVQPNTGGSSTEDFVPMVKAYADQDVGLTLFGIGDSFGYGLALEISDLALANYYYLEDGEDIRATFEDLDYMVTPLARDFRMSVYVPEDLPYVEGYNMQASDEASAAVEVVVTTLFISEGSGASVLRFELPRGGAYEDGSLLAEIETRYEDLYLDVGAIVEDDLEVTIENAAGGYDGDRFQEDGIRKGAALINMGLTMIAVCEAYHGGGAGPQVMATLDETIDRLAAEAAALGDAELGAEVELLEQLRENVLR